MTAISAAYLVTDPWLYWPLDDGTVTDIGSNGHDGTLAGGTDMTAPGVEKGRTALHMDGTGSITSTTLGLNTLPDITFACYVMAPTMAAWNSFRALLTIGVAGAGAGTAWGAGLGMNGVSGGIIQPMGQVWPTSTFGVTGTAVSQPVNFWHHLAMVYVASTKVVTCYTDGVPLAGTALAGTQAAFKVSDRLVVSWSSSHLVIAHIAFWRQALTSTQVANIGGFATSWPPNSQFDTGGSGGGGDGGTVTIGEPQATQITNIENNTNDIPGLVDAVNFISDTVNHIKGVTDQIGTDVTNIVNTLFPQLADVLNDIGAAVTDVANRVTGTMQDGHDLVVKTVGELLSTVNTDALDTVTVSRPNPCSPVLEDLGGRRVYGIVITITAYPDNWEFRTPDNGWSLKDLAVARIYHNGQLVMRQGIHTISHTMAPIPQRQLPWILNIIPLQPDGTILTIDWATGVCGDVEIVQSSP